MIPAAAGENVYYQVAEGAVEETFNSVKYKNAAFTMYFVPNYLAYTVYTKALAEAQKNPDMAKIVTNLKKIL